MMQFCKLNILFRAQVSTLVGNGTKQSAGKLHVTQRIFIYNLMLTSILVLRIDQEELQIGVNGSYFFDYNGKLTHRIIFCSQDILTLTGLACWNISTGLKI